MSSIDTIKVNISEKDLIKVDISEKELINIDLKIIDIFSKLNLTDLNNVDITNPQDDEVLTYDNGVWVNKANPQQLDLVYNETPVAVNPLPSKIFETAYNRVIGSLSAYLNGQKIHSSEITEISATKFSFPINIVVTDLVEVNYTKS